MLSFFRQESKISPETQLNKLRSDYLVVVANPPKSWVKTLRDKGLTAILNLPLRNSRRIVLVAAMGSVIIGYCVLKLRLVDLIPIDQEGGNRHEQLSEKPEDGPPPRV